MQLHAEQLNLCSSWVSHLRQEVAKKFKIEKTVHERMNEARTHHTCIVQGYPVSTGTSLMTSRLLRWPLRARCLVVLQSPIAIRPSLAAVLTLSLLDKFDGQRHHALNANAAGGFARCVCAFNLAPKIYIMRDTPVRDANMWSECLSTMSYNWVEAIAAVSRAGNDDVSSTGRSRGSTV
jgi:hypothetical protein